MFEWNNEESRITLERKYLLPGETTQEACWGIANKAADIMGSVMEPKEKIRDKIYELLAKGWIAPSSPIWSNFRTNRGSGIACFGSYIEDTMDSILNTAKEVGHMTKIGGGTSAYFGNLRAKNAPLSIGGFSNGPISFMQIFDTIIRVVSQQNIRRGSMAAYIDVDHPDILDFLKIKTTGHPIQDLSSGVCITNKWMEEMLNGDSSKRNVWLEILRSRKEKGYPYLFFTDIVNDLKPDVYKDKGLKITHSNLCEEIKLADTPDKSFVCCLTAMNLEKYNEWKDTDAVKYAVILLDAVMEDFIIKNIGKPGMERAVKFAVEERALGLGATGWHSYLQSEMISFDSLDARYKTVEIFSNIQQKALEASKELAKYYGEPELLKGYGRRNSTLMAIAPNTSSSEIMGQCSQGIEPFRSNYFVFSSEGRQFTRKNKYLEILLESKGKNDFETWQSILVNLGSVKHLDFLSQHEKNVFKTFWEIDQYELLRQARIRQDYIDQGTSLNLFMPPDATAKQLHDLHIYAWQQGLKGLYYLRSEHPMAWSKVKHEDSCSACAG
jgi:ribonucleoside-diphosphate reductase alpha chain